MKFCSIPNCNQEYEAKGYCKKHYQQFYNHRDLTSNNQRNRLDRNEIIIEDNICHMKLYNNKNIEVAETIFDLKYKIEIEKYKWCLNKQKYSSCNYIDEDGNHHNITLHQAIIRMSGQIVPEGYEIDHKDTNRLNNLEDNLRICTELQNQQNSKLRTDNKSGYKGVILHKSNKKWMSYINFNKKRIYLGLFDDPKDAAIAYNTAAIQYHGEFARINQIKGI